MPQHLRLKPSPQPTTHDLTITKTQTASPARSGIGVCIAVMQHLMASSLTGAVTSALGAYIIARKLIGIAPPFGCRTSSLACARTTNALVYLMRKRGHHCLCYLDDFVGLAPSLKEGTHVYNDIHELARQLGLVLAPYKCISPTKSLEWLGFDISATNDNKHTRR